MIIRRKHTKRYTVVPNSIFNDDRLSIAAKGLLGYLLSRPPDWCVRHDQLQRSLHIGRKFLSRSLQELINAGYVARDEVQGRDDLHRFTTYNYIVSDTIGTAPQSADNGQKVPLPPSSQRLTPQRPKLHLIVSKEGIKNSNYKTNPAKPDRPDRFEEPDATETRKYTSHGWSAFASGLYPVYEHSKPFQQWAAFKGADWIPAFDFIIENGQKKRVVWTTSLYPPKPAKKLNQEEGVTQGGTSNG